MGMAASQARYLALTARKTNTEYEGQQINQARTALANQSANLFNRLLNMDVPNPPKTSDYTKLQYSYSDGENEAVIDDWKQLSTADPDYNYLVKSHYFTDLYTGSLKKMTDPQVQIGNNAPYIARLSDINSAKNDLDAAKEGRDNAYTSFQNTLNSENSKIALTQAEAQMNNASHSIINTNIVHYSHTDGDPEYYIRDDEGNTYTIYGYNDDGVIIDQNNATIILNGLHDMVETGIIDLQTLNGYLGSALLESANDIIDGLPNYSPAQLGLLQEFGLCESPNNESHIVRLDDITALNNDFDPGTGNLANIHYITGTFLYDSTLGSTTPSLHSYVDSNNPNGIEHCNYIIAQAESNYAAANTNYQNKLTEYENMGIPTYIGNSELTYLNSPTPGEGLTKDQETELLQIIKDMNAQGYQTNLSQCFDDVGNYLGGVYSFKLNGTTYYTTYYDLKDAYNSYQTNPNYNNYIDDQYKMPYYNASYINTRIEQTTKALLETDGNGRFKSVRFDNDSVVYSLNTETITDEAAYEDAMNKYLYEKDKYEKTIADINAKTSIIQKEDRTLELRLKQLDTEQNALKTEMEAVKKVIKDNVESTFKTFSD